MTSLPTKGKPTIWRKISTFRKADYQRVDIWLTVPASPRSFGIADAWRVCDAWRKEGKWYHVDAMQNKEIVSDYVTHWMEIPAAPEVSP